MKNQRKQINRKSRLKTEEEALEKQITTNQSSRQGYNCCGSSLSQLKQNVR